MNEERYAFRVRQALNHGLKDIPPAASRRLEAARRSGIRQIPGLLSDGDAAEIALVENLVRQEGQSDLYALSFTADRIGKFTAKLPPIAGGVDQPAPAA